MIHTITKGYLISSPLSKMEINNQQKGAGGRAQRDPDPPAPQAENFPDNLP
jgi:hypothetical protein